MVSLDNIHIEDKSSAYTALFAFANSLALYVVGPIVFYTYNSYTLNAQCSFIPHLFFSSEKKMKLVLFPLSLFFWPKDICVRVRCASTQNSNIVSNEDRFFCLNKRKYGKREKKMQFHFVEITVPFFNHRHGMPSASFYISGQQWKR